VLSYFRRLLILLYVLIDFFEQSQWVGGLKFNRKFFLNVYMTLKGKILILDD